MQTSLKILRLLHVEDNAGDAALIDRLLKKEGYAVHSTRVDTLDDLRAALPREPWNVLISDYRLPGFEAPAALAVLKEFNLDIPFIVVSGQIGEDAAVNLMRSGAQDYVGKDHLARLGPVIQRELVEADNRARRRVAEAREQQSYSLLHSAMNSTADGLLVVDLSRKMTWCNQRFFELWRIPVEMMQTRDDAALIAHVLDQLENPAEFQAKVNELYAHPESNGFDLVELKDGRTYERISTPQRLNGNIVGRVWSFHDITNRRLADNALLESEQRYERVVANIQDALVLEDLAGHILFANERFLLLFGFKRAELAAVRITDYVAKEFSARFKDYSARLLRDEAVPEMFEYESARRDGSRIWLEIQVTKVHEHGKLMGTQSLIRDITLRKLSEKEQYRSQRLQSIGTLAGGIAHDLNNAISPIMMSLEILKADHPEDGETLGYIETSARRAADMVRQLLTFAKGAEGKRVSVQTNHLVNELASIMKSTFPKNISLAVNCERGIPPVLGDATQIHQVLLNLCVNARDAMPEGGKLRIETQCKNLDEAYTRTVPEARPGKHVLLRVSDTGSGIPPEILDRIFDPFFTTKAPDKGTGLGLSTVLGIVQAHGGFLRVHSDPGQGSNFEIFLPAEAGSADQAEMAAGISDVFLANGECILLVDDELAVRKVAETLLRRMNCTPLLAVDGNDGLIKLMAHGNAIKAVITDLQMPQMGGLKFIRALRQIMPDVPVIVASGHMDDTSLSDLELLGVTQRLDKPFTGIQLVEKLKPILAGTNGAAAEKTFMAGVEMI